MVNNVGKTTRELNTNLGGTTQFTSSNNIIVIAGEIGRGFLIFDSIGTVGVVSNFTDETDFSVTTHALSIDINNILSLEY